MTDLAIITPTRGRPERFAAMVVAVEKTAEAPVCIVSCLDLDDATRPEYDRLTPPGNNRLRYYGERRSLSAWTNAAALAFANAPNPPRFLASLGDDHRPRTPGWDRRLIEAIEKRGGSGFAFGNDLYQGVSMPTAWVVSADIVRELGWMMLPTCEHMYVDAAVLELGRALDLITYVPEVIIEHVHPAAGKVAWDDSYRASNASDRYREDEAAFTKWRDGGGLADDVKRVRTAVSRGERV